MVDNVVVATVEAGAVKTGKAFCIRGRKSFRRCTYRSGEQFVALEGDVGVDVQFHVLGFQRGDADGDFSTPVAHGADVRQQGVVGEWRHADIVEVEHIGGAGVVIVGGKQ